MRSFIRHPTNVPMRYVVGGKKAETEEELKNISHGGLCFVSAAAIEPGTSIQIRIPIGHPPFESEGIVVWCNPADKGHEVGVSFHDIRTEFSLRMIEQICQIELYREKIKEREGRVLSGKEAALEWIERYADEFPS